MKSTFLLSVFLSWQNIFAQGVTPLFPLVPHPQNTSPKTEYRIDTDLKDFDLEVTIEFDAYLSKAQLCFCKESGAESVSYKEYRNVLFEWGKEIVALTFESGDTSVVYALDSDIFTSGSVIDHGGVFEIKFQPSGQKASVNEAMETFFKHFKCPCYHGRIRKTF